MIAEQQKPVNVRLEIYRLQREVELLEDRIDRAHSNRRSDNCAELQAQQEVLCLKIKALEAQLQ